MQVDLLSSCLGWDTDSGIFSPNEEDYCTEAFLQHTDLGGILGEYKWSGDEGLTVHCPFPLPALSSGT